MPSAELRAVHRGDLIRATRGRLSTATAAAVGRTDTPELICTHFDAGTDALPGCGPGSTRICEFIAVLLTREGELDEDRAGAPIPYHDPARPRALRRPATGWFGQLVPAGDLNAAGCGAQIELKGESRIPSGGAQAVQRAWQRSQYIGSN